MISMLVGPGDPRTVFICVLHFYHLKSIVCLSAALVSSCAETKTVLHACQFYCFAQQYLMLPEMMILPYQEFRNFFFLTTKGLNQS